MSFNKLGAIEIGACLGCASLMSSHLSDGNGSGFECEFLLLNLINLVIQFYTLLYYKPDNFGLPTAIVYPTLAQIQSGRGILPSLRCTLLHFVPRCVPKHAFDSIGLDFTHIP